MSSSPTVSSGRDIHEQHRVSTPLELLFDLTFVVAIAQAASHLHHGVAEHHTAQSVVGYLLSFAAIWWAWMNYTWFASAYDDDSAVFRVLTMLQMGGVLVLATGVPDLFHGGYMAAVIGYVIMRLALCVQWLRAAKGAASLRRTCLRYAGGIALVQLGWLGFLVATKSGLLPAGPIQLASFALMFFADMAVPLWAEKTGATPWHAHHIAERYSLMVIIVLGECVLGATNSIANMWQAHGWSVDLGLLGLASILLVFCLWWMYFLLPSGEALHHHRERAWGWGYGHYLLFAAIAAIGSGLEVVADVVKTAHVPGDSHSPVHHLAEASHGVSPLYAITMVALAEAIFVAALWFLRRHATRSHDHLILMAGTCLCCISLGPLAVSLGVPLSWGLLLLSAGPVVTITYIVQSGKKRPDRLDIR